MGACAPEKNQARVHDELPIEAVVHGAQVDEDIDDEEDVDEEVDERPQERPVDGEGGAVRQRERDEGDKDARDAVPVQPKLGMRLDEQAVQGTGRAHDASSPSGGQRYIGG